MNDILNKKFKHHKWFLEGVTVAYALDYFASSGDFGICKKLSKKQSGNLLDELLYDYVIYAYSSKDKSTYRLSQVEKDYYLERIEYWKQQRKIEKEKWLNTEINTEEELKKISDNISYEIKNAKLELKFANERNDKEGINYWKVKISEHLEIAKIINKVIDENKNNIKTNKDFKDFEYLLMIEISNKLEELRSETKEENKQ